MDIESKLNPFRILYFSHLVLVFLSLMLIWLTGATTSQFQFYAWSFIGGLMFLIADFFVAKDVETTTTFNASPNYLIPFIGQKFRLDMTQVLLFSLLFSVVVGVVQGAYYIDQYSKYQRVHLIVPNMMSALPLSAFVDARLFSVFASSYPVAGTEEMIFSGIMFTGIWSTMILLTSFFARPTHMDVMFMIAMITMIPSALIGGYTASYVYHNFVYGGNLVAFKAAFEHFTIANVMTGVTGTNLATVISHTMHNAYIKYSKLYGKFTIIEPREFELIRGFKIT